MEPGSVSSDLKCAKATFSSVEDRADGDDDPSGFGAVGPASGDGGGGDRIAANASAGAI